MFALPFLVWSHAALGGSSDADDDLVCDDDEDRDSDGTLTDDDTDDDGIPDAYDVDDDGDGIPTRDEDFDNNGDPRDDDLDGFGLPDYLDPNTPLDVDRDGYIAAQYGGNDCDDSRFGVNPAASFDPPYDGVDQDCDGSDDYDQDGDGYRSARTYEGGDDCDDNDPDTHPGAEEDMGPADRDCDGWTDPIGALTSRGGCDCASGRGRHAAMWMPALACAIARRRRP